MALDVVFFDVHGRRCALPVAQIQRVVALAAVTPLPLSPAGVLGVTSIGTRVLPVVDPGAWLARAWSPSTGSSCASQAPRTNLRARPAAASN